ncbi:conserved hypothetical protein [Gammaproteobacteria bacterium]
MLKELAKRYQDAKNRETLAIAERRDLAKKLEELISGPDEGTAHAEDGDYKVTVTRKLSRVVDNKRLQSEWRDIPEKAQGAFKWVAELSLSNYRHLDEESMAVADSYITSKPASSAIEVKEISHE